MDREELLRRGRRSYERGRLRAAIRVVWWLIPLTVGCALATGAREACACIGVALLFGLVYLRWRDRAGAEIAAIGSMAGAPSLIAGLLVASLQRDPAGISLATPDWAIIFATGLVAGIWLAWRHVRKASGIQSSLTALAIAVSAAALGCVGAGVVAVSAAAAGLILGSASRALSPRAAA